MVSFVEIRKFYESDLGKADMARKNPSKKVSLKKS